MTYKVYPYGQVDITVDAGDYLKVATSGSDYASIYYGTTAANFPVTYYLQQNLDNDEVTLGAMTVDQPVRLFARADIVYYDFGSAPVIEIPLSGLVKYTQANPTAVTATGALSAATLIAGLITANSASGAITLTTDTGANLDAALPNFGENDAFDFSIINTGATTETVTVAGGTGVTLVGDATILAVADVAGGNGTSATFRLQRTATAATWNLYRLT